jgi:hypothetical protein
MALVGLTVVDYDAESRWQARSAESARKLTAVAKTCRSSIDVARRRRPADHTNAPSGQPSPIALGGTARFSRAHHGAAVAVATSSPSSRGLGRGPFKAKTWVRIPLGTFPLFHVFRACRPCAYARSSSRPSSVSPVSSGPMPSRTKRLHAELYGWSGETANALVRRRRKRYAVAAWPAPSLRR